MITSRAWTGQRYAVLGLARSGLATVAALIASGAEVVAWDSDVAKREALKPLPFRGGVGGGVCPSDTVVADSPHPNPSPEGEGLSFADPLTLDLNGFAGVVVSPGVPLNCHPIAAHAKAAGVPVIGDIELFAQARAELPPHKVVGITGTNGKSTTTALVHHILQTAGVPTTMGGNIGLPILGQEPLPEGGVYALELSSYQIDLTFTLDCDVAVLTNLSPDHLDRYNSLSDYYEAKRRLFEMQTEGHIGIFFHPDDASWRMFDMLDPPAETWVYRGQKWSVGDDDSLPASALSHDLTGPHNLANAYLADAACVALGVNEEAVRGALGSFKGLPHRMERVRDWEGVTFVNDSKATNAEAAAPALAAFRAVRWIVGGKAKTAELDACMPHLGHVRSAYTIGEAGPMLAELLRPKVPVTEAGTLDRAVAAAAADAQSGDTVLLSPACASLDQFRDFEDRGDQFRALVKGLKT